MKKPQHPRPDKGEPPSQPPETGAPAPPTPGPGGATLGRVTFSSGKPLPRTTGLEDVAFYEELFKDYKGPDGTSFRRGRVWS